MNKLQLAVEKEDIMKYPNVTLGRVEAVWNKLGGEEGVDRFLCDELIVSKPACRWREQDGAIYFTLPPTDGTTGSKWIKRLEKKGFRLSKWAKDILKSRDFKPTKGVKYEIAVLKGMLFKDNNCYTSNIRVEAEKRNLIKPNAEVACLIRENFSDEEIEAMGLWWVVTMHEPIKDSDGDSSLLNAGRDGDGRWLVAHYGLPGDRWDGLGGFAFVVSQVST